jgi:nucleotide-binding universal stress UspA family protein
MYEKILIPLDGSEVGESALPYVENLLSKLSPEVKVEVTLLQVLRPVYPHAIGGYEVPDVAYTEKEMEETKKKAVDYLNKAGETLRSKGATVTSRVGIGDASEEIIKVAEEINADLIAMSTHGRSGFSRWAFGSVTDKVLRRGGRVPILTVRAPRKEEKG